MALLLSGYQAQAIATFTASTSSMADGEKLRKASNEGDKPARKDEQKAVSAVEELNEEDQRLAEELETLVDVLAERNAELHPSALSRLSTLIRTSTSSMTAVPKPLKFAKPHYPRLVEAYRTWVPGNLKSRLAGVLSVLGMTQGTALQYRLLVDKDLDGELEEWGHDYLRHLALEIGTEYHRRAEAETEKNENELEIQNESEMSVDGADGADGANGVNSNLISLALQIVPFFLQHNAETDAVDLLLEVDSIERLVECEFVDSDSLQRVCQYLVSCSAYLDSVTAVSALKTAYTLHKKNNDFTQALVLAMKLDAEELVRAVFTDCEDKSLRKQLALILARHRRVYDLVGSEKSNEENENEENEEPGFPQAPEDIAQIVNNTQLQKYFAYLVKELNLEKPKHPAETLGSSSETNLFKTYADRAKMSLASIFVRGFMNAGFCNLGDAFEEFINSLSRHRNSCATAVHGIIGLGFKWNYNEVVEQADQYTDPTLDTVCRAGAVLAFGVGTSGIHDDTDAVAGILKEYIETFDPGDASPDFAEGAPRTDGMLTCSLLSLGFAYAGTSRRDMLDILHPYVSSAHLPMETVALAALALGLIFVGSADGAATAAILEALLEREASDLSDSWAPMLGLGLALLYVGKTDLIEAPVEAVKAIDHPVAQSIEILLVMCAYAGSGNVLQIQRLLNEAATRVYEDDDEDEDDEDEKSTQAATSLIAALAADRPDAAAELGDSVMPDITSDDADAAADDDAADASATSANADADTDANETTENVDASETAETEPKREDAATLHELAKVKALCTLGVAVIAMGESIGEEMVLRHLEHLMHYGDSFIKQAVPLAMGLLYTSNPQMKVYETLSRYTHESDFNVAANAVFAMGLVGAGTLNARVSQLLRQLDDYHARQSDLLFMVRFALGLLNLGKGTQTLSPFSAEKQLMSPVSFAGLLITSIGLLMPNSKQFMLTDHPNLFFSLGLAIQPRMIVTVDEDMNPLKVTVRIGQAVDTVGQAGKPKRITGWVTQDTPVLLSAGERAELENDEYEPLSSVLEGIVILRKKKD